MAKVDYWSATFFMGFPSGLLPGESFSVGIIGFADGDAIQVTAHPGGAGHVRSDNTNSPLQPVLEIEDLEVNWNAPPLGINGPGTRGISFEVTNVGPDFITDFLLAISTINK